MTSTAVNAVRPIAPPRRAVDDLIDASGGKVAESPVQIAIERLKRDRLFHVATVMLLTIVVSCLAAPWFAEHWAGRDYAEINMSGEVGETEVVDMRGVPAVGPGFRTEYTLGADALGRDVFMRILEGGKVSLLIGFGGAAITTILAVIIGTWAAYKGGRWDMLISRYFDIQMSFPTTILMIALSTALLTAGQFLIFKRGSILLPLVIIGVVAVPGLGRIIRSQVLSIGKQEFVEAAQALGASDGRIVFRQIIPNVIPTVITYFGLIVSAVILSEAGLSFLGVGVLPPTPSWGNLIADGRPFYSTAWWIMVMPGLAISMTVLSLNLIGESLKDALDPKAIGGK